jgi:hypothetical protein
MTNMAFRAGVIRDETRSHEKEDCASIAAGDDGLAAFPS